MRASRYTCRAALSSATPSSSSPPAMAVFSIRPLLLAFLLHALARTTKAQLSPGFYSQSCPDVQAVVRSVMSKAIADDKRNGAAVLRLLFHDCFVNGCDASVLLDDTATTPGEKNTGAGASLRGFEVIDAIKTQVEATCAGTVSCADILALAARDSVNLLGGPSWAVPLGRRDSPFPNRSAVETDIPGPDYDLPALISAFNAKGLTARDMAALSGAHTVGAAACSTFRVHVYCDANASPTFASVRQQSCPVADGDATLAPLDALTPDVFDNGYFQNLVNRAGLLHSDQELFNNGPVDSLVRLYSTSERAFDSDFVTSIIKLGNISPLTGSSGEIRLDCRKVNS